MAEKSLKDALVDAAESIILEQGWQAVRARAVAERADCAVGSIYTAYPDLDGLIMAVKSRILEDIDARMAATAGAGPLDRLTALGAIYLDYALAEPRRWKTLFEHHLPEQASLPDWYLPKLARLFAHVDGPLAELLPRVLEIERMSFGHALFAAVHGIVALGIEGRLGEMQRDEIARRIDILIRSSVAGRAAM